MHDKFNTPESESAEIKEESNQNSDESPTNVATKQSKCSPRLNVVTTMPQIDEVNSSADEGQIGGD